MADRYAQVIAELTQTIEACTDGQWAAICGGEGWTVAATAHHLGAQLPLEREYLDAAANGTPMPTYTWDDINGLNERRAKENAGCSKADALKLIRDNTAATTAWVRGLSDEQLDRTASLPLAGGATVTTQQLIEGGILIEHATAHLASIRAAG